MATLYHGVIGSASSKAKKPAQTFFVFEEIVRIEGRSGRQNKVLLDAEGYRNNHGTLYPVARKRIVDLVPEVKGVDGGWGFPDEDQLP